MKRIFMIDGHALLYRAYFAFLNRPMVNTKGVDTSAIYGFCRSLFDIILKEKPSHLLVAFDPGGKNFRHEAFPEYKANRPETPQVIKDSLPVVREFLESCRIPVLTIEKAEADDVIGTLSKRAENEGFKVFMVTPDKDYGQLVSENILMYRPLNHNDGWEIMGVKEICEKYGISDPGQVIDILAIWGDTSDNIPGVRGIGEVGAKKLVSRYGSVENILENLGELSSSLQDKLNQSRETLFLSKDLATIRTGLDIPWNEESFRINAPDLVRLKELLREYEFHSLSRMLPRLEELFCCNGEQAPKAVSVSLSPPGSIIPADNPAVVETIIKEALRQGKAGLAGSPQQLVLFAGNNAYLTTAALAAPLLGNRNIPKCGFKLKDLMLPLSLQSIPLEGMLWDPDVMHYLVNPERNHRPADLAIQYLNYFPAEKPMESRSLFDAHPEDDPGIQNLVNEAFIAFHLKEPLLEVLRNDAMETLYTELEMPLMEVLAAMEKEGVRVDIRQLEKYGSELNKSALEIERQIREHAGDPTLNVSSPKQVGIILYDKLKIDDRSRKGKKTVYNGRRNPGSAGRPAPHRTPHSGIQVFEKNALLLYRKHPAACGSCDWTHPYHFQPDGYGNRKAQFTETEPAKHPHQGRTGPGDPEVLCSPRRGPHPDVGRLFPD